MAAKMIAKQAKKELVARQIQTSSEPTASVGGFPFLTQVASGRYHRITIRMRGVTSNGVTLPSLDVVATDVRASVATLRSGSGRITADTVDGSAVLDWNSVRKLITENSSVDMSQIKMSHGNGDQIKLSAPFAVAGISTTLVATGTLVPDGNGLRVKVVDVSTQGGQIPPLVGSLLTIAEQQLAFKVNLPVLPYQMKVKAVHPTDTGLKVTAEAQQVPLSA